jgi:hypothetical protein
MAKKDSSKKVKYFNAVLLKCHEIQHELLQINKKIAWDEEIDEHTDKIHAITTELVAFGAEMSHNYDGVRNLYFSTINKSNKKAIDTAKQLKKAKPNKFSPLKNHGAEIDKV